MKDNVSMEIRENTEELQKAYQALGKAYYEGGFEDPLPQLLPLFDKITRLKKEAQEKPEAEFCPACGFKLEKGALFCGNCGQRLR